MLIAVGTTVTQTQAYTIVASASCVAAASTGVLTQSLLATTCSGSNYNSFTVTQAGTVLTGIADNVGTARQAGNSVFGVGTAWVAGLVQSVSAVGSVSMLGSTQVNGQSTAFTPNMV